MYFCFLYKNFDTLFKHQINLNSQELALQKDQHLTHYFYRVLTK